MLQATYNNERCKQMGNQPLMAALVEMMKCENAIDGLGDDDEFAVRVWPLSWCYSSAKSANQDLVVRCLVIRCLSVGVLVSPQDLSARCLGV